MKLDLEKFRKTNTQRAVEGFKCYNNVPLVFWGCAIAGEVGELCNIIKKLDRVKFGGIDAGNSYKAADVTPEMIKDEIGGIAIYLDLISSLFNLSLEDAIIETFNSKSEQFNFIKYVPESPTAPLSDGQDGWEDELWNEVRNICQNYIIDVSTDWESKYMIGGMVINELKSKYTLKIKT